MKRLVVSLVFLGGCASHVSWFVRDVRALPDGTMHVERCELIQSPVGASVDVGPCTWRALGDGGGAP